MSLALMSDDDLKREYARAAKGSAKRAEVRSRLSPGTSRARVTTANARWMRAAEYRDLVAEEMTARGLAGAS